MASLPLALDSDRVRLDTRIVKTSDFGQNSESMTTEKRRGRKQTIIRPFPDQCKLPNGTSRSGNFAHARRLLDIGSYSREGKTVHGNQFIPWTECYA